MAAAAASSHQALTLTEIDPASLSKTDPPERTRVRDRHASPVDKEEGKGYKEIGSECAKVEVGSCWRAPTGELREKVVQVLARALRKVRTNGTTLVPAHGIDPP
jgi:hypothetical protein